MHRIRFSHATTDKSALTFPWQNYFPGLQEELFPNSDFSFIQNIQGNIDEYLIRKSGKDNGE